MSISLAIKDNKTGSVFITSDNGLIPAYSINTIVEIKIPIDEEDLVVTAKIIGVYCHQVLSEDGTEVFNEVYYSVKIEGSGEVLDSIRDEDIENYYPDTNEYDIEYYKNIANESSDDVGSV